MVDRIGQQFGNYQIIRLLGQGAFADVYLAEHKHLEIQVAIKVLSTRLTSDNVEQFRSEARMVARLIHPNIVRVFDYGVEDNTPYLIMDYVPYGSLRQRHSKGSYLSPDIIIKYIKQVAAALQFAHEKKLIHRDIKPENMLLGESDTVILSDFGIAVISHSSSSQITQNLGGTIPYMAPEQIKGKPLPASDQYSLGVVTYEWLCGMRPFHGSFTEIATQHIFTPPPPLHEKLPSISTRIEEVVMIALAKDPKQRFPSVQEFASALEQSVQLPLPPTTIPPFKSSTIESSNSETPPSAGQTLELSNPSFSQNSLLNSKLPSDQSNLSTVKTDPIVPPQQLVPVSHLYDQFSPHQGSLERLQSETAQNRTWSTTTATKPRRITQSMFLIILLLVLILGGVVSYFSFRQFWKGNISNTNQLRISSTSTLTPMRTPTLQASPTEHIVALGYPIIDKYTSPEIADGQTVYTVSTHAVDRQTGLAVHASDITCKIWLTSDGNVIKDVQGDGGVRLKSIANLAEPFPGELAGSLNFDPSTQQVQSSNSDGQASWKYSVSRSINPGIYNLVILLDWHGVHYDYVWVNIRIVKTG